MSGFCDKCGAQLPEGAKFCDACGAQTSAEQAAIKDEQEKNAKAAINPEQSMKDTIYITIALTIAAVLLALFVGFSSTENTIASLAGIGTFAFIIGLKWFFEIKAQRRWKKEAEEKAKGGDHHDL